MKNANNYGGNKEEGRCGRLQNVDNIHHCKGRLSLLAFTGTTATSSFSKRYSVNDRYCYLQHHNRPGKNIGTAQLLPRTKRSVYWSSTSSTRYGSSIIQKTKHLSETKNNNFSLDGFNPFEQDKATKKNTGGGIVSGGSSMGIGISGNQISSRQTSMKDIVNQILNAVNDDQDTIQHILEGHRNFLMEPFDNLEGFLESDSIYNTNMSRQQRLLKFQMVMDNRIDQAKNGGVKTTLQVIKDFVLKEAEASPPSSTTYSQEE